MSAEDAIRFLEREAWECRDRDMHEALCLLLPALLKVLHLSHMTGWEAAEFRRQFHDALKEPELVSPP